MTDKLCSHAGSCEDNLRDHGGAFCANTSQGASMSEEMELRCRSWPDDWPDLAGGVSPQEWLRVRAQVDRYQRAVADAAEGERIADYIDVLEHRVTWECRRDDEPDIVIGIATFGPEDVPRTGSSDDGE